jgi:acetyltransferase-like isoleucine patch superfamily enzyme
MAIDRLNEALDMPWAVGYEIHRWLAFPYIRIMFTLHGIAWGQGWRVWGMPIIQRYRGSIISIGDGAYLRSWKSTNPLVPHHPVVLATRNTNAKIILGNNIGLTGTTIVAAEYIEIGNSVQIGSNTTIVDTDFHPLDAVKRQTDFLAGKHAPVMIKDNVFIGMNCLILKGVHIGQSAVVGAGSVVSRDIPENSVVAGNPARIINS